MSVTKFDDKTEKQLREIVKRGISSFKVYLAYKGAVRSGRHGTLSDAQAREGTRRHVTAHCENETLIAERAKELLAAGKTDSGQHHEAVRRKSRPRA